MDKKPTKMVFHMTEGHDKITFTGETVTVMFDKVRNMKDNEQFGWFGTYEHMVQMKFVVRIEFLWE